MKQFYKVDTIELKKILGSMGIHVTLPTIRKVLNGTIKGGKTYEAMQSMSLPLKYDFGAITEFLSKNESKYYSVHYVRNIINGKIKSEVTEKKIKEILGEKR